MARVKSQHNLGDLYHKVCMGDPLSDQELGYFIQALEPLVNGLHELGQQFRLPFKELHATLLRLQDYKANRKRKA